MNIFRTTSKRIRRRHVLTAFT